MSELSGRLRFALAPILKKHTPDTPIYLVGPLLDQAPKHLSASNTVIFVDGGARHKHGFGFSAGDGDSFVESGKLDFEFPKEKDQSDLGLVLMSLLGAALKFELLGFSGGRRDHDLFNLGEINRFLKESKRPTSLKLDQDILFLSKGSWRLNIDGLFSVATLSENQVSISGQCKYQIMPDARLLPLESYGLSNSGTGEVKITAVEPLFIYADMAQITSLNAI